MRELGCNWELGFLRVFLSTIVFSLIIVKPLQLHGRRQIAELRKYCLVRVIVFFGVCFLYLFCFSQVGILVKFPTSVTSKRVCIKIINDIQTCLLNHSRKTIISCAYVIKINNKMWEIYMLNYIVQEPHKQLRCSPKLVRINKNFFLLFSHPLQVWS